MHNSRRILPLIIISILSLLELYAYFGMQALKSGISDGNGQLVASIYFGLMAVSFLAISVIFGAGNRLGKALRNFFFAFVFINLFTIIIFDFFLVIDDLFRLFLGLFGWGDFSRSIYILTTAAIVSILPAILFIAGMIIGPYRYRVKEIEIPIDGLPESFEGLKIVQISDIHSGSFYNPKAVQKGVNLILDQKPDVIFFTGDLVNDDASEMDNYQAIFKQLNAPMGVFSILGNHDYGDYVQWPSKKAKAQNLQNLKDVHAKMGWRLLLDEHVYLEKGGKKIALLGVENWGKGFHQVGDLAAAYQNVNAKVKLLLSHDPTHWDEEVTVDYKDIDLTFSGHTHGAQMGFEIGRFKWSPIQLRYKKWAGLYQAGNQHLYINRGFGFLGYPGRLGIWPEITVIRLVAKKKLSILN